MSNLVLDTADRGQLQREHANDAGGRSQTRFMHRLLHESHPQGPEQDCK